MFTITTFEIVLTIVVIVVIYLLFEIYTSKKNSKTDEISNTPPQKVKFRTFDDAFLESVEWDTTSVEEIVVTPVPPVKDTSGEKSSVEPVQEKKRTRNTSGTAKKTTRKPAKKPVKKTTTTKKKPAPRKRATKTTKKD